MRPNLINRLKEEWNNLDPVDPLRGLIADAIDALAEQPAQRTWVGLTDDEVAVMMMEAWGCASIAPRHAPAFAQAIEAKLREKNA